VTDLLNAFAEAWRSGARPDAAEYLDRAPPGQREELAAAIEGFLAVAPEPDYDANAWAALTADPAVPAVAAEAWSTLLPRLRERRGLSTDGLAAALADRFAVAQPRTRAYLDDLEHDRLRPERLSRRLLDALAALLDAPAAWLERAASTPAAASALYRGRTEERLEVLADAMLTPKDEWDAVDELFQGGR
jgi:transcriptional regulator with XRE-family HTH domain